MQGKKSDKNKKTESAFDGCVSFGDFKKALGQTASRYSDEEIERQRVIADRLADLFFDAWLKKVNNDKIVDTSST